MNKDLKEALDMLLHVHAVVWMHLDPGMDQGAKQQPKEIKAVLKRARAVLKKNGMDMEGRIRGE